MTSSTKSGRTADFWTPGRIAIAAVTALTLIFIFGNTRRTKVRLLIPEVTMPLWLALFGTAAIGVICGFYWANRRPRR